MAQNKINKLEFTWKDKINRKNLVHLNLAYFTTPKYCFRKALTANSNFVFTLIL